MACSGPKLFVNTVLHNGVCLWAQFMESYIEQCLILMVLQTIHLCLLCTKDCEEGDNQLQFLGLLECAYRGEERDSERIVITDVMA